MRRQSDLVAIELHHDRRLLQPRAGDPDLKLEWAGGPGLRFVCPVSAKSIARCGNLGCVQAIHEGVAISAKCGDGAK